MATICWATLISVLLATVTIATAESPPGALVSVLHTCCGLGREWFTTNRERCPPYSSAVQNVSTLLLPNCQAMVMVCCLAERRDKECIRGKQNARIRRSCSGISFAPGNEDEHECCNCCQLGLAAKDLSMPCTLMERQGPQCRTSFTECCGGVVGAPHEGPRTPYPTRLPPIIPTAAPATPATTTARGGGQGETDFCAYPVCAHVCIPTPGSYRCACHDGFTLLSDGRTCRQNEGGDRCKTNSPCEHECVDTGVAIHCRCFTGFDLQSDGRNCVDIDECTVGTHTCTGGQRCLNEQGSFTCIGQAPQPIPPSETCRPGYAFYSVNRECEDVDECARGDHRCTGDHQTCRNTLGSFVCECVFGFQYNRRSEQCEDINECALNRNTCVEGQTCENTPGSYVCRRSISCGTGYTLDTESQRCQDDDECNLGTHNCGLARECNNIPGSFRCVPKECQEGHKLNYRTGACEPIVCRRGLKPDRAGNCIDINECAVRQNICRANQECRNTPGSYECRNRLNCGPGFKLNEAGNNCDDIDECAVGTHDCTGTLMECVNRRGTYHCQCPAGYQMDHRRRTCQDINECTRYGGQVCSINAECENTPGSFKCTCKEGFESKADGRVCRDINECLRPGMCQHSCRNTWGSFQCTCKEGYTLSADARSCTDVDECELWANKGGQLCLGLCENTPGSYRCVCPPGYIMMSDQRTCQDVDECAKRTANCHGQEEICINTRGSYKCETVTCPKGFVKAATVGNRNNRQRSGFRRQRDATSYGRHGDRYRRNRLDSGDRYGSHGNRRDGFSQNYVRPLLGQPPAVSYQQEDGSVVCQRLQCGDNDISCLLNKTKSIQWQHVALPSIPIVYKPVNILNVQTKGYSVYPNVRFQVVGGNEGYLFDVVKNYTMPDRGQLRLLRPIQGPNELVLKLKMDNRNRFDSVISSHVAFVTIYVSPYSI